MDKVIGDNKQAAYQSDKKAAEAKGIIVLENNLCFEIWLLLHFMHTGKPFTGCGQVALELKKPHRIPYYDKTEKFLRRARLYHTYKTALREKAIHHAKRLEKDRQHQDLLFPRAQTYAFFEWYFA